MDHQTETRLALVELSISRFDTILERLTDVSSSLKEVIAIHGQRLEQQERVESRMELKVDKEMSSMDNRLKRVEDDMDKKLSQISKDVQELKGALNSHNTHVMEEFSEFNEVIDTKVKEKFTEYAETEQTKAKILNDRLDKIDRYIWIAAGVVLALGFGLDKLKHFIAIAGGG